MSAVTHLLIDVLFADSNSLVKAGTVFFNSDFISRFAGNRWDQLSAHKVIIEAAVAVLDPS